MKNKWINFDPYLSNIKNMLVDNSTFNDTIAEELIKMLRNTQATGVYVVLLPEGDITEHLPALYLRDYDPILNSYSNDDIYVIAGSSDIAKDFNIPLDQNWKPYLEIHEDNRDFIKKPYESTFVTSKTELLGYWSKPFKLNEEDVEIITYSVPFLDGEGRIKGIFGIEITLNYLIKYLPTTELQPQDSLGYLIGYCDSEAGEISPIIMNGALQNRMIDSEQSFVLTSINKDMSLYQLMNHKGNENLYVVIDKVGLYQNNTPFENEEWFIVGIMREDYLLKSSNQMKQILWLSLIIAIILGGLGGILTSFQITKPIVSLAKQVRRKDEDHKLTFDKTGYLELDELSKAIENAHEMMIESASRLSKIVAMFEMPIAAYEINKKNHSYVVTENFWKIIGCEKTPESYEAFSLQLDDIFSEAEQEEPNIFKIKGAKEKWIKLTQSQTEDIDIGAIVDVTDEILEKKQIRHERDHDALTQILNRKGFQWEFENWYEFGPENTSALIMFDLDNLKGVNDQFGHKWGDQYIITFVKYLQGIAKNNCIVGRRSGDEFVCLLHDYDNQETIRTLLDQFYETLKQHPMTFPDDLVRNVSVSGGLIWITNQTMTYDELLHYADEALYEAKQTQKGTYLESMR